MYKRKISRIFKSILTILLLVAILGGAAFLIHSYLNDKNDDSDYVSIYFVASDDWKSDGSLIGAYVWIDENNSDFKILNDYDNNGIYTLNVKKDYVGIIFVDLKLNTEVMGLNWANVRVQTEELTIPTDDNVYYHQYENKWVNSGDLLYDATTKIMQVGYVSRKNTVVPVVYYFDKFGMNDAGFVIMNEEKESCYSADIPVGYTHIIFLEYTNELSIGTWDDVGKQSDELLIPINHNIIFDSDKNIWVNKFD